MDKRYQRAKKLFEQACDLEAGERRAFLDRECAGDGDLRAEVESLLLHDESTTASVAVGVAPAGFDGRAHIGRYRIIREIGRGGMGVVYLGVRDDPRLKQYAAIKVVKRGMDTEEILRRFELERQLLATLNHPGIGRLFDGGETPDGLPYFAMEYVEGQPIDRYCDTRRLRIGERLELFRKVCSAVHYAHQNLVVHRDLKPSNILVTSAGEPKLLDFGIAKLINPEMSVVPADPTAPQLRVMTPEYASPEQVRGDPISTASDVYSLGVILYELVTGHRPYRLRSRIRAEIERVICEVDPDRPSTAVTRAVEVETDDEAGSSTTVTPETVSRVREGRPDRLRRRLAGDIDNMILMALRKEPQRRYGSAEQLGEDLRRHLAGLPVAACPDTVRYRVSKFVRRNRLGVGAAAAFVVLLLAGATGTSSGWAAERRQHHRAQRMFDDVRELAHTFMFDFHDAIQELDGSIPARELLVTTALQYLDALRPEAGDDPVLQLELANAYDRVGDIRGGIRNPSLGDTPAALQDYRTALELREAVAARLPADAALRETLCGSYPRIGDMLMKTGDVPGALEMYGKELEVAEALARQDDRYRRTLSVALANHGRALRAAGRLARARQQYGRSLSLRRQLRDEQPDSEQAFRDLSVGLMRVAEVERDVGDDEAALGHFLEAVELRRLAAGRDPDSSRARRDLAWASYFSGDALLRVDRPDEAVPYIEQFVATARQRAEANPTSLRAQRDRALGYEILGMTMIEQGDPGGALAQFEAFETAITAVSDMDPDNAEYRGYVAAAHQRIAGATGLAGDHAGAVRSYRRALRILDELAGGGDAGATLDRAGVLSALGESQAETGRIDEAEASLESALALYEDLLGLEPEHAAVITGLAETLGRHARLAARQGHAEAAIAEAGQALDVLTDANPGPKVDRMQNDLEQDLARYRAMP